MPKYLHSFEVSTPGLGEVMITLPLDKEIEGGKAFEKILDILESVKPNFDNISFTVIVAPTIEELFEDRVYEARTGWKRRRGWSR